MTLTTHGEAAPRSMRTRRFNLYVHRCNGRATGSLGEEATSRNEIAFPLSGAYVRRCSHSVDVADPTTALFFQKDMPYEIDHPICGGDATLVVQDLQSDFNEKPDDETKGGSNEHRPFIGSHHLTSGEWRTVIGLHDAIHQPDQPSRLFFDETLILLTHQLCSSRDKCASGTFRFGQNHQRHDVIRRALLYINQHYCDQFSIDDIARSVGSSPFHLCRLFKQQTGLTLHGYQLRRRIRESINILRYTHVPVADIALDMGFSSQSHFGATFLKAVGETPGQFRNQFRGIHIPSV